MDLRRKAPGLNKAGLITGIMLLVFLLLSPAVVCRAATVNIVSKNLSHRVLVTDTVQWRLKLLIGFSVTGDLPSGPEGTGALGVLSKGGTEVSSFTMPRLDYLGGNLAFYLPYDIAPGDYDLHIELKDIPSGAVVATKDYVVESIETVSHREGSSGSQGNWMQPPQIPLVNPPAEALGAAPSQAEMDRGYILWHRNPFRYVYPNSAPQQSDLISGVSIRLARNEYEPATFSLYALEDLGTVSISVSPLTGPGGSAPSVSGIYAVRTVPRIKDATNPAGGYEMRPRLLVSSGEATVDTGQAQRFWLTIHAAPGTTPGSYTGSITITTGLGVTAIPLRVEVLPFTLAERPDKEYAFTMTYEFQEMTSQDLTEEERAEVYASGLKYYRSFREHGLSAVIPHSPFVFRRLSDGSPDLRDLEAALRAFEEAGFTGPFIYYCGHLVQSAKPGWAGSTLGYDGVRHPLLMKEIISYARQHFPEMSSVDFYWMPGDEVHDSRGGPSRMEIAENLLNAIWEMGEKTAISVREAVSWPVDIKLTDEPLNGEPWYYPNYVTNDDAEAMRRVFGLYHVKSQYVGVAPWTFQTSENAAGDPYTDLDAIRRPEVMVAYPGTDGPMPTPEYEAMREGIEDGRYAYLLKTLIEAAGNSTDAGLRDLASQADAAYQSMLAGIDTASLEEMEENRETMATWIIELSAESQVEPPPEPDPSPSPTPDPEPAPDPTPDPVEPEPDPVEPTPDPAEPTPDPVEPDPDPVEPIPDTVAPAPPTDLRVVSP
jgi:hypothetical protein